MIGNVIQSRFLEQNDYPIAAALSFLLMAAILIAIFFYARALGTEGWPGDALMTAASSSAGPAGAAAARDSRPPGSVASWINHRLVPVFTALAILYLLLPIFVMIAFSFNDPPGRFNFVWGELLARRPGATRFGGWASTRPSSTSLVVGVVSTLVATILGTLDRARPRPLRVPRPGRDELAHLRADGHAGDRHGRQPPDALRGAPPSSPGNRSPADVLPARLPDDPRRPHHVQHQLRRRDGPGPHGRASTGASRRRPWTSGRTSGRPSGG